MYTNSMPRPQRGYNPRIPRGHAMSRPPVGSDRLSDRLESRDGSNARHFPQMPLGGPPPPHHHQGTFNPPMPQNYETRPSYNSHNRGYQNPTQMSTFVAESPSSTSHEENVKYVHEGLVQYYQEKIPNSQLDGFQPFDFDLWYASNCGKQ